LGGVSPWHILHPRNPNSPLYEEFLLLIHIKHPASPISIISFCGGSAHSQNFHVFPSFTYFMMLFFVSSCSNPSLIYSCNSSKTWGWIERSNSAFEDLKRRIFTAPVLKLLDFEKSFEVQMDT
jgi:hypothetical protein